MNRRHFVLRALLLAVASAFRPLKVSATSREKIIVIGAGMSGIAAARTLVDRGFDVTVIEARSEIGGRIRQDTSFGLPLDLGASFITTSDGNPLTALAKQFGAKTYNVDDDSTGYVDSDGEFLDEALVDKASALYEKLKRKLYAIGNGLEKDRPASEVIDELLEKIEEDESEELAKFVKFLAISDISGDYAADPAEYSTKYFENDGEYSGPDLMVVSGYRTILNGLARGLQIKTGAAVSKISHSSSGVTVETSSGTMHADRVIVTVPLGVLKRGNIVFSPELPTAKKQAIEHLGMGLLDKLYLKFPSSFWREQSETMGYFGNLVSLGGKEYPDFYLLDRPLGQPILLLFSGSTQAKNLESLDRDALVTRAMGTLRKVYGKSVPDPTGVIRTSWGNDPHAYGSYSFAAVNAKSSDYVALAEPISSRVFFAGEATEHRFSASVHGAYLSGLREARKIADLAK